LCTSACDIKIKNLNITIHSQLYLFQKLENTQLTSLEVLDVSRNNIGNISPGTFKSLKKLKTLNLAVNMLRTVSIEFDKENVIFNCYLQKLIEIGRR
jgi:Leucine-rich repeat (LRR) protein